MSATISINVTGSVAADYVHYDKEIVPDEGLALPRTYLKWYDIQLPTRPVPAEVRALARERIVADEVAGILPFNDQIGFVFLHRCGESFYFLGISTWRNDNELWLTVYYKDASTPGFQLFPRDQAHKNELCVWEFGAAWHERNAYNRFLSSARDEEALQVYIEDQYSGVI